MKDIKKASKEKKQEKEAAESLSEDAEVVNIHKNRDFVNNEEADRDEHYTKSGHQVMI